MRPEASKAVEAIVEDLSDRAGIGSTWDSIDEDVQAEIREVWGRIVDRAIDLAGAARRPR